MQQSCVVPENGKNVGKIVILFESTKTYKINNAFLNSTHRGPFYWVYDVKNDEVHAFKKLMKNNVSRRGVGGGVP